MHHSNDLKHSNFGDSAGFSLLREQSVLTEQNSTIRKAKREDECPEDQSVTDSDMEELKKSYDEGNTTLTNPENDDHVQRKVVGMGSRLVDADFDSEDTMLLFNFNRSVADLSSSTHHKPMREKQKQK